LEADIEAKRQDGQTRWEAFDGGMGTMMKTHYSGDVARNDMRSMQGGVSQPAAEFNLL
jgi:hypothetical protein